MLAPFGEPHHLRAMRAKPCCLGSEIRLFSGPSSSAVQDQPCLVPLSAHIRPACLRPSAPVGSTMPRGLPRPPPGSWEALRIALVGRDAAPPPARAGVQIRVLGLVGQVRGAVLHLGDLRTGSSPGNPVLVRELLALALAVQTRQVLSRWVRNLDHRSPGPSAPASPGIARVWPHDVAQRLAEPPWSRSSTPMRSPFTSRRQPSEPRRSAQP